MTFDGLRGLTSPSPGRLAVIPTLSDGLKLEGVGITPDGATVIATTAFDRWDAASARLDAYNILVAWPAAAPQDAYVIDGTERGGTVSSASLRATFAKALASADFPEGPPYFKVEGVTAIPGDLLLFAVREEGRSYQDFTYVAKVVSLPYTVVEGRLVVSSEARVAYAFNPASDPRVEGPVGLSSVDYDAEDNSLLLLTSLEAGTEAAPSFGGFLWRLKLAALDGGRPPTLVETRDGKALRFEHKAEGIAILGSGRLMIVHDDDRLLVTRSSDGSLLRRRSDEAPFTIVQFD